MECGSYSADGIDMTITTIERAIKETLASPTNKGKWTELAGRLGVMQRSVCAPVVDTNIAKIAMRGEAANKLWKALHILTQTEKTDVNRCAVVKSIELWSELVQLVENAYAVYSDVFDTECRSSRNSPVLINVTGRVTPTPASSPSPPKRIK